MEATPRYQRAVPVPFARLLSRVEAAAYLSVSPSTFDKMVASKLIPDPKRLIGRRLAWDIRALDRAIDALPGQSEADENPWDE